MARSGVRIQVLLPTALAEDVELIAKAEGVSLSKVVGQAMEQHAKTGEFQARLTAANKPKEAIKALISDLPAEKQALILQALAS